MDHCFYWKKKCFRGFVLSLFVVQNNETEIIKGEINLLRIIIADRPQFDLHLNKKRKSCRFLQNIFFYNSSQFSSDLHEKIMKSEYRGWKNSLNARGHWSDVPNEGCFTWQGYFCECPDNWDDVILSVFSKKELIATDILWLLFAVVLTGWFWCRCLRMI